MGISIGGAKILGMARCGLDSPCLLGYGGSEDGSSVLDWFCGGLGMFGVGWVWFRTYSKLSGVVRGCSGSVRGYSKLFGACSKPFGAVSKLSGVCRGCPELFGIC